MVLASIRVALQRRPALFIVPLLFFFLIVLYLARNEPDSEQPRQEIVRHVGYYYFKFQKPYLKYDADSNAYEFAVVADKDRRSRNEGNRTWESILKKGVLRRHANGTFSIAWEEQILLTSQLAEAGRAMELSSLTYYNDMLLTVDDRTGIVFSIEKGEAIPVYILMDGDGRTSKGFKAEWTTVKDGLFYVGSTGREWTTEKGVFVSNNPQWIKTINEHGRVVHVNWASNYEALRKTAGAEAPGYLLHEAAQWNPVMRRWVFLPRRFSAEAYDDKLDESRGSNLALIADESFKNIQLTRLGPLVPTRGFSSFVFLPGREHELLALKSEEVGDTVGTYVCVLNLISGDVLMEDTYIGDVKYEGVEIL